MKMKRVFNTKNLLVILVLLFIPSLAEAQCAMCRAVLESESSQNAAEGINDGILYLMIFPYLLVRVAVTCTPKARLKWNGCTASTRRRNKVAVALA